MDNEYKKAEQTYHRLKQQFRRQEISRQEFLDAMKNLQVRDDQGRLWMIGNQSGKWYFLDGKEWIQADPPSQKKESRPVCPYCGLENKTDALVCARCGGNVRLAADICPQCGSSLQAPLYRCPVCDVPESQPVAKKATGGPYGFDLSTRIADEFHEEAEKKQTRAKTETSGMSAVRSIGLASLFFFGGSLGIVLGIVLGAFAGSTRFLEGVVVLLPTFFRDMQGTLLGAVVYSAAGGLVGFVVLGLAFFLSGALVNLLLSFVGGIKIRMDVPPPGSQG